jgi:hypothetical protein
MALRFLICARQKFYQAKTTPAAAASRRPRRAANQNPNGIQSFSPALTRQRLRWVNVRNIFQPGTGCIAVRAHLIQPVPG